MATETFPVFPGRSICGRLSPLPASSIIGVPGALDDWLQTYLGSNKRIPESFTQMTLVVKDCRTPALNRRSVSGSPGFTGQVSYKPRGRKPRVEATRLRSAIALWGFDVSVSGEAWQRSGPLG